MSGHMIYDEWPKQKRTDFSNWWSSVNKVPERLRINISRQMQETDSIFMPILKITSPLMGKNVSVCT